MVLTYGIPPEFRGGVHLFIFKPPYAIVPGPSISGHAIAYRWRSLPRVRQHRAGKPQGSSERMLHWRVTMEYDQLICAPLSHTHCWYEVGMLRVPAVTIKHHSTNGTIQNSSNSHVEFEHIRKILYNRNCEWRFDTALPPSHPHEQRGSERNVTLPISDHNIVTANVKLLGRFDRNRPTGEEGKRSY